jgi:hypothetical protein
MDGPTILPTDQPTDKYYRGAMHVPKKEVGYLEKNSRKASKRKTRTGDRYQERSNFDVTSFRHQLISSSFSFSRNNCDVTSFPCNFIVGTDQQNNGPTDGRTNQHSQV